MRETLERYMEKLPGNAVMVAFSGGVDSGLLLAAACRSLNPAGRTVYAATVRTSLHPAQDAEVAKRVAGELGARYLAVEIDELKDAGIENNPPDRCYRCKKFLFSSLKQEAEKRGIPVILEGSNADDTKVYRPGLPYGTALCVERMRQVDEGERFLRELGFYNVRLRAHGDTARIEVDRRDMGKLLEHAQEIAERIRSLDFSYVTLDLEGFRSGSMDIGLFQE